MGVMADIRSRLEAGAEHSDLVAEGYSSSSVYAARQSLKRRSVKKVRKGENSGIAGSTESEVPAPPRALSSDPEIAELQKKVVKKNLNRQLEAADGPIVSEEVMSVFQTAKRDGYSGTVKNFVDWAVADTLRRYQPEGVGERLSEWAKKVVGDDQPVGRQEKDNFEDIMASLMRIARMKAMSKMI